MKEEELREMLERHGWRLRRVIRYRRVDRVVADYYRDGKHVLTIDLVLRCKLEDWPLEDAEKLFSKEV